MYSIPKKDDAGSGFGMVFGLACVVASIFYRPHVFMVGWGWHATPLGLPAVAYWQAMGLMVLARMTMPDEPSGNHEGKTVAALGLTSLMQPAFAHFVMWLVA